MTQIIPTALLIIILNLSTLVVMWYLRKKNFINQLIARKLLHILSALGAVWATTLLSQSWYIIICGLFFILYVLLKKRNSLRLLEPNNHVTYGAPLFPLGLLLMALVLWNNSVFHIIGILLLGIPDSLAAIVEEYSIYNLIVNKSILRMITYFSLSVAILLFGHALLIAITIAILLTVTEKKSYFGLDNITVPAVYCLAIFFLRII